MTIWHGSACGRTVDCYNTNRGMFTFVERKDIDQSPNNNLKVKAMALEFTDSNFDELVMKADKPVLVDFWAEWCGPCRMVGPVVEELAKDYEGKAVIGKVNVDNNPNISAMFGIRNIPTLLFFKDGKLVDKQVGAVPKSALEAKLNAQLA
jgi:thioredoxin 1